MKTNFHVQALYFAFANSLQGSLLNRLMEAMVLRGLIIRQQWNKTYAQVLKNPGKDHRGDSQSPGYAPSDLSPLEQIEGVMTDILVTYMYGRADKGQIGDLASYLVEERRPCGTVLNGSYELRN